MSGFRLPAGGRIVRARPLRFRFGGRIYTGFEGDTLASALIANGVDLVGRSFKYHRPRGVFSAGPEEPNAIVQVGDRPNLKATQVRLVDGLEAGPVNCWPSVGADIGALAGLAKRFLPAGFYYKTFQWPAWRLWEPIIRRAAGLGRVDPAAPTPPGQRRHLHADVLVVGGGIAGLAAARAAARAGARVVLVEREHALGGAILTTACASIDGVPADAWLARTEALLAREPRVRILRATTVFGCYDHGLVGAVERDRIVWKIRARSIVLATGAVERPIAFADDDKPGVMLAGAVRAYLERHGVAAGRRLLLFANNDQAYRTALAWAERGLAVAAVVDPRAAPTGSLPATARARGLRVIEGAVVERALGWRRINAALVRGGDGRAETVVADTIAVSGGYDPAVNLFAQSGGELLWSEPAAAFVPGRPPGRVRCTGAVTGSSCPWHALSGGHKAGADAARAAGAEGDPGAPSAIEPEAVEPLLALWHAGGAPARSWVDRASDVTVADIELAARENYASVEHFKRYTTSGMSPDQGKASNVVALALLGRATGRAPAAVGTTRFRAPYDPVPMAALAGADRGPLLRPLAHLPAHECHVGEGALFEEYGGWLRPSAYPRAGEDREAAIRREAQAVRAGVGLFDASPLGKLIVEGPDAGRFLDRMYVQRLSTLKPGRLRYVVSATEHGIVFDDGVVARLGADRFLVGTTSGGAGRVAESFEEWLQCEWVELRVLVTPVTSQWGVVTVAGPGARALLAAAGTDIDLTSSTFPHMTVRDGRVAGIPARVSRVSFTGELSYEIAVPARSSDALWRALRAAGPAVPFGIEAVMTLRIEKGYLHVGADTDGTTYPADCGFADAVARRTDDFVGRRSMQRPDAVRPGRRQFVGLEAIAGEAALHAGAHVVAADGGSDGHVSSACFSPALGRRIALAMIRDGFARTGETVAVDDLGTTGSARIVPACFVDPDGTRLRG